MKRGFLVILGPAVILALWHVMASLEFVSPLVLPAPWPVFAAGWELLSTSHQFWSDIGATLIRTVLAVALSSIIGVPIGLMMGLMPKVYTALGFPLDFLRSIPPIALFPLFMLAFGLGEGAMVAVPVYGCALVLMINSIYGVVQASPVRREVSRIFQFTPLRTFIHVILPDALPQILGGLRVALSLSLVLTIVVEMLLGTTGGLGRRIYDFHLIFKSEEMYFTIILVGLLGYLLNFAFVRVERKVVHWAGRNK